MTVSCQHSQGRFIGFTEQRQEKTIFIWILSHSVFPPQGCKVSAQYQDCSPWTLILEVQRQSSEACHHLPAPRCTSADHLQGGRTHSRGKHLPQRLSGATCGHPDLGLGLGAGWRGRALFQVRCCHKVEMILCLHSTFFPIRIDQNKNKAGEELADAPK